MPDNSPSFRCGVDADGDVVTLRPAGELDIRSVPVLQARLTHAYAAGAKLIVVDLRGLEFMDSSGLTLLTRWSLHAERDGFDLALVAGSERIQRLFALTRLIQHFRFVDG